MKTPVLIKIAIVVLLAVGVRGADPDSSVSLTGLKGAYLGQKPPGQLPVLFAPGIVSTAEHRERDVTFTSDMREFYFTRDATIMVMKQTEQGWTAPQPVSFSADYFEFEAFVAPGGQTLYYISNRSVSGEGPAEDYQMWVVKRRGDNWGTPRRLTDLGDFYPTITRDGVMYFTSADNDLYRTRLVDGQMSERERLGDSVNTARAEYNSCIAPDESFLIFTSMGWGDGFGGGDLWVSFRKPDGSWGQPRNMGGGINSNAHEYCPAISQDGKYLFFASNLSGADDILWVDAGVIDRLKTEDLNTADMLFDAVSSDGIQAGMEMYVALKARYSDCCIFDGRLLAGVADRLIKAGRVEDAAVMIRQSFNLYPQTVTLTQTLKLTVISPDRQSFEKVADELRQTGPALTPDDEAEINRLGYRFMGWNRVDDAVRILGLNTQLFPGSANVFDSYGEALLQSGDTTAAAENYRKSLELNPDNTNAANVLKQIGRD